MMTTHTIKGLLRELESNSTNDDGKLSLIILKKAPIGKTCHTTSGGEYHRLNIE